MSEPQYIVGRIEQLTCFPASPPPVTRPPISMLGNLSVGQDKAGPDPDLAREVTRLKREIAALRKENRQLKSRMKAAISWLKLKDK